MSMKRAGRGLMFLTPAVRRGSAIVSHSTSQLLPRRTAWLHLPVYTISLTLHTMMPISSQSKGQRLSPHSHDTACGSVYLSAYSYLHQGRGHTIRSICLSFCLSVCLSVCVQDYRKSNQLISLKLGDMIGPTSWNNWLMFGGALVSDTDSGSLFHFPYRCGIRDFRRFL